MVQKHENYLSEELFDKVWNEIQFCIKEPKFYLSSFKWDENVVHGSTPVLIYSIGENNPELFQELLDYDIKKLDIDMENHIAVGKSIHFWSNGSYIPWHNDECYSYASTLYLNKEYDKDWGGYFMYEDGEEIKAVLPKPNLLLEQPGGTPHCTTDLKFGNHIPYRISLQTFIKTNNEEK